MPRSRFCAIAPHSRPACPATRAIGRSVMLENQSKEPA